MQGSSPRSFIVVSADAQVSHIHVHPVLRSERDMPTANMSLTAIRLPMVFIGGVFVPVQALPVGLQFVSYLTPLTYSVDALREAMVGSSAMYVVDLAALLVWSLVSQALAIIILNRKANQH